MKDGNPFVSAVIVAAGGATRMGMNKMLLDLGSRTVFERTVDAFEECGAIDEVVIVSSKENTARYRELVRQNLYSKVTSIVSGGPTRQESVRIGLTACDRRADLVAVHDGARPLIKPDTIVKAVDLASEYGAAAAALSPSIWFAREKLDAMILDARLMPDTSIYMDYGSNEMKHHAVMEEQFKHVTGLLLDKHVHLTSRIVPGGDHCEASWERQIPFFMNVLLYQLT